MKYLLGEASADEKEQVMQWLKAGEANQVYFDQLKKVWDTSRQVAAVSEADENKAWQRFQQRIHGATRKETPVQSARFGWMRIAAAVVILIGLATAVYFITNQPAKEMIVQAQQTVLNDTLPDGSVVTVNKGSSISYPAKFKGSKRPVTLKGEAFFNVTPDKKKPFVIAVNDVEITVVGTSFNVKSSNGNTEVVVETGIVRVTKAGKTVELRANEKLLAEAKDTVLVKEEVSDKLYNYYRTREFVCDDTPLWKLVDKINEAYGANIVIGNEELRNLKLNTTFNNESLDQVLNVISLTFNISVARNGDTIILQ
ncbi:MAG: FecR domain-containing protein [Chitinophagaceae bacterium]|nr:FecR domain-containing protein [Chitinophagaceae bacterium]